MTRNFILRGWRPQLAMRLATLVAFTLAAVFSIATVAAGNSKLLTDAQQLLDAENPKQAYKILVDEQKQYADNRKFDFLLGVAALGSSKIDDSIVAFERVLADKPNNAEASMYLGKAYFLAGSMDLAEATFRQLKRKNPPPLARATIDQYLQAIAQRREQGKRAVYGYGELSLGYDSNITGVPSDFTAAVVSAFNIPGIDPTGNSIKRKAAYFGAAAAVDYVHPFNATWSGVLGAEARGRAYRRESAFNSVLGDVRAGMAWNSGVHGVKLSTGYSQFRQKGDAPGDPMPTNDRKMTMAGADYRYSLSDQQHLNFGVSGSRVRFPQNDIEDFDAVAVSAGWQQSFTGNGTPVMQISGYYSRDEAVRKLADGVSDKGKRVGGLRGYYQYSLSEKLSLFNGLGFTTRRDQSAFARATQIEFGRDQLTDITLGVNWRFQPKCALRAQWFGSRNDSNIAIYDYTRNEMSSNIRCDFM